MQVLHIYNNIYVRFYCLRGVLRRVERMDLRSNLSLALSPEQNCLHSFVHRMNLPSNVSVCFATCSEQHVYARL